jgi:hypothetical protein
MFSYLLSQISIFSDKTNTTKNPLINHQYQTFDFAKFFFLNGKIGFVNHLMSGVSLRNNFGQFRCFTSSVNIAMYSLLHIRVLKRTTNIHREFRPKKYYCSLATATSGDRSIKFHDELRSTL